MLGLISLALLFVSVASEPTPSSPRLVYQFPLGTFAENIECRPNGHLLISILSEPVVYTIDPTAENPTPKVVHNFTDYHVTGMTGITETNIPDVFAVIGGRWNITTYGAANNSFSVFGLDFRNPASPPIVTKIAHIPNTNNLNGLTTIDGSPDILLMSDSVLGAVWSLNTTSNISHIAIQDKLLLAPTNSRIPLGINGINAFRSELYFAFGATYGSVPINGTGDRKGPLKNIVSLGGADSDLKYDDFTMDFKGNAYLATHPDQVHRVSPRGERLLVAKGKVSTDLAGPTSTIFGRGGVKEEHTLYMTAGGISNACGSFWGAQILAVDDVYPPAKSFSPQTTTVSYFSLLIQILGRPSSDLFTRR